MKRAARRPVVDHNRQSVRVAGLDDVQRAAVRGAYIVLHSVFPIRLNHEMSLTAVTRKNVDVSTED